MKRTNDTPACDSTQRPAGIRIWSRCEYHVLKLLTSGPLLPTTRQLCRPALKGRFSTTAMRKAISKLHQQQWIERYRIEAFTTPLADKPRFIDQPAKPCPDFRQLKAGITHESDALSEWRTLRVYLPSRQAANLFGSPYRAIEDLQTHAYRIAISHALSRSGSRASIAWIWETLPNLQPQERALGLRIETAGRPTRVIAILHAQSSHSLERLHAHCRTQRWPIELW